MEEKKTYLKGFEEIETGIGEDHPQLLPAVRVLELPQQVATEHGLERQVELLLGERRGAVPADVHRRVGPLVARSRRQRLRDIRKSLEPAS